MNQKSACVVLSHGEALCGVIMLQQITAHRVTGCSLDTVPLRLIFRALLDSESEGLWTDAVSLSEFLGKRGQLIAVGGLAYLGYLVVNAPDDLLKAATLQ